MKTWQRSSTRRLSEHNILLLLALAALLTAFFSLCLGAEKLSMAQALGDILTGQRTTPASIVLYFRLPRTCAALLAGAALAVSGVVVQGVLSNSLAAPSTIGVNAGAGLAVALFCAIVPTAVNVIPFAALAGAFGGVMLVLLIAEHTSASKITLVLAGVAVSGIFSAAIDAVITFVPEALNGYSDFRIGGFNGVSMDQLSPAVWIILLGLLAVLSLHNELDILMLGTEQAQSLGLPARRLRTLFLVLAAALAGSAVSFSGLIGFVGLIVPHMMRQLLGEESRYLVLGATLGGAALLCGCDLLARVIFSPFELPVGIVMSLVGGPFFLWLLRKRGGYGHD